MGGTRVAPCTPSLDGHTAEFIGAAAGALAVKVLVTGQDGAVVDAYPATTSRGGGQRPAWCASSDDPIDLGSTGYPSRSVPFDERYSGRWAQPIS